MKDNQSGAYLSLVVLQAVLAVLCFGAYGGLLLSGGGPGFGLTLLMGIFLFLTNGSWLVALSARRQDGMVFWLWLPWVMNCAVAGTQLCWGVIELTGSGRGLLIPGMIASPFVGMAAAVVLRRVPKKTVVGAMAIIGVGLVVIGATMVANSENHSYGKWERLYLLVSGIDMVVFGLAQSVPLCVGYFLLRRRAKTFNPMSCARCGYDLRGTLPAGLNVCPECGLKKEAGENEAAA